MNMKYELKSVYLEDEEIFAFELINKYTEEYFEWTVNDVKAERFLLFSNKMIVKITFDEKTENFIYELVRGNGTDLKEKLIKSTPTNIFEFESEDEEITILYDFYKFPDEVHEIAGMIMGEILLYNDGGFFEKEEDYDEMEERIVGVLSKFSDKFVTEKTENIMMDNNIVLSAVVEVAETKDNATTKKTTNRKKTTKTSDNKTATTKKTTKKSTDKKDVK